MQRAHAMASSDAAERAKAIPNEQPARVLDSAATGRFKTPAPAWNAVTPPPAPKPVAKPSSQPYHVGSGVDIPETSLSLELTPEIARSPAKPATPMSPIIQSAAQSSGHHAADNSITPDLLRARELAKQSSHWRQQHGEVPTLDSTQTIRTLTKNELADANREKWFTVQLALSDHPANLDTMPRLDIFEAYSLYSVAALEGSKIRHALRLGFFKEEVSAEAVMGYLKTFFNEPVIVRISDAEHTRFADTPKFASMLKQAASTTTSDQNRPTKTTPIPNVPTINAAVTRTTAPNRPAPRTATPPTKRAPAHTTTPKSSAAPKAGGKTAHKSLQQDMLDEARLLGLSETAILRVQKNPSLLSRLVGKLTK